MLLSSLEHFRRLLHALGADGLQGGAMTANRAIPPAHALRQKQAPRYRCVPVQPNERPDKPWQRAARSCSRLRLSFRNMVHARPVLRWRTGSNAPRCRERYKSLDFEKYVRPLPHLFPPRGKGCEKNCFVTWLVFALIFDLLCVSCPDIYIGNTFGRTLMRVSMSC